MTAPISVTPIFGSFLFGYVHLCSALSLDKRCLCVPCSSVEQIAQITSLAEPSKAAWFEQAPCFVPS